MQQAVTIQRGLSPDQRADAARIYWDAFGGKLGRVLGPEVKALHFLNLVLRSDHCFAAVDPQGHVLGIAGFKSPAGSFAGGTLIEMRRAYGYFGAAWRGFLLGLLTSDVDNQRFLVDGIAVDRELRGRGIGAALLQTLCCEAQTRGYGAVRLEVIDTNWRARALYEREGFVVTAKERLGLLRLVFGFAGAFTMVRVLSGEKPAR